MVHCEGCKADLDAEHLHELEDKDNNQHLVCTHCFNKSKLILRTFDELDWKAFVNFVKRYDQDHKDYKEPAIKVEKSEESTENEK